MCVILDSARLLSKFYDFQVFLTVFAFYPVFGGRLGLTISEKANEVGSNPLVSKISRLT